MEETKSVAPQTTALADPPGVQPGTDIRKDTSSPTVGVEVVGFRLSEKTALALIALLGSCLTSLFTYLALR